MRQCKFCGTNLEWDVSGRRRYCNDLCNKKYQAARVKRKPVFINCLVCGERIPRSAPNSKMCTHRCEPKEGLLITCTTCGEPKDYESFRDYRGQHPDGKLRRECIDCNRSRERVRYYEKA